MTMAVFSAPGKIYLFGEHAVVYGKTAIACAVNLRTRVSVERSDDVVIRSVIGTTGIDHAVHPYISKCIEKMRSRAEIRGVKIDIESDIPVSAGLGSSAAVTVAVLSGLNEEFGAGLDKMHIASLGHEIETEVQGAASPTDTYVSTMGGIVVIPGKKRIPVIGCRIVIGNTNSGVTEKKTARLVAGVRELLANSPGEVMPVIDAIGRIAEAGERVVNSCDYVSIGRLMNVNHGLLDALGVGTARLAELVYAARDAGAFGAKITGAGGGGCMFALTDDPQKVAAAIEDAGGTAIVTRITEDGVRQEC